MKISFITTNNALDIHNWSGTIYHMAKSIESQDVQMDYIGDLDFKYENVFKTKQLLYKLFGKRYIRSREPFIAKDYAKQVLRRIASNTDVIFSPESIPLALINTSKPKVFYSDATFASMINYYDEYSNLCEETVIKGNFLEQQALNNSQMAIFASEWAAQSAISYYNISPDKVKVVPLGANIICNRTLDDIRRIIQLKPKGICNLLMLGVDWERKGGDLVIQIAKKLNDSRLNTHLHVAGIQGLDIENFPSFVTSHGFISKSTPEGQRKIDDLMLQSHFLVVPSKAEAFGVVFCEASSFGLPSLSTKTGGITTIIRDDINGRTFSLDSKGDEYANYILDHMSNFSKYEELALSSFNEYQSRLSWEASGKSVKRLLEEL